MSAFRRTQPEPGRVSVRDRVPASQQVVDRVHRRADAHPGRQLQQQRSALIFRKFQLNPGVGTNDVDAGDLGGQLLTAHLESALVEDVEPRVTGRGVARGDR